MPAPALHPAFAPPLPPNLPSTWAPAPPLPQTMLLVEDSRIAAEAVRLICRRLGVRLRRADCLSMARAHLRVCRPDVVLVDPGLPDGSGLSLIAAIHRTRWRAGRIVGFSGDPAMETACRRAGADGFIAKPLRPEKHLRVLLGAPAAAEAGANCAEGIAHARSPDARPAPGDAAGAGAEGLARVADPVALRWRNHGADPLALCDDLRHARALLGAPKAAGRIGYTARFLSGIARCVGDAGLMRAAERALVSRDPAALLGALDRRMHDSLDCL